MATKEENRAYRRSKKGLLTRMYGAQVAASEKRGHRDPEYTKEELYEWAMSQELFHRLHSEWVSSGYLRRLTPSVDRIYDEVCYCMVNIQLMTAYQNTMKYASSVADRSTPSASEVIIYQYTKDGDFVFKHDSIQKAADSVGGSKSSICKCANGHYMSSAGYVWTYFKRRI